MRRPSGKRKEPAAAPSETPSAATRSAWRAPPGYRRFDFRSFVEARQAVLEARRQGHEPPWTDDPVLQHGKFCNIDRRDDAVSTELLSQFKANSQWGLREHVLLSASLRFTGSRRGEAALLAQLVEAGRRATACSERTPLCAALHAGEVRCGTGTYQMSLNRQQVASRIEAMAEAVVAHVSAHAPFADVLEASNFIADHMTVGKRPQFSANETAKDFACAPASPQP